MVLTSKYTKTVAGTITKEQTLLPVATIGVGNTVNIVKGNVCTINETTGMLKVATSTSDAGSPWFVALENANNTLGSDGDITCPVAKRGHYVTVVSDGTIHPGQPVKVASTAGQVIALNQGTDAEGLKVGIYWGKEGGIVTKDSSTPYAEAMDTQESVPAKDAADGDIIEIELR